MFSSPKQAGFSLIEVLVTTAIIGLVTALVMVRYGVFNSAVLLKNQAFEIGLDLREAQVYAIAVRGTGNQFREEYGVHFNMASPQQYIFFLDNPANGVLTPSRYNSSPSNEQVSLRQMDTRFQIERICINTTTVATPPSSCSNTATWLDVSFSRPDFDARMRANTGVVSGGAYISIVSLADSSFTRQIIISPTGQITVE